MSWSSFKDLAQIKAKQTFVYQQARESLIISEANKLLAEILPESKNKAQVIYLKNNILTIAVLSNQMILGLANKKMEFLQSLNKKFADKVAEDWQILT